jgi:hypothetical protein
MKIEAFLFFEENLLFNPPLKVSEKLAWLTHTHTHTQTSIFFRKIIFANGFNLMGPLLSKGPLGVIKTTPQKLLGCNSNFKPVECLGKKWLLP